MELIAKLAGYKTYIIAFLGSALALATAIWPELEIPSWGWTLLGFLGLGALRNAKP